MADIILGAFFIAISVWVYLTTRAMPKPARFPGPGFFPGLIALALLAASSLLVLRGIRALIKTQHITIFRFKGVSNFLVVISNFLVVIIGVFIYIFLSPRIGFFLSAFLSLWLVMLKLRARIHWALLASAVTAALTKALFQYALHVPLPNGPLPGGW